MSRADARFLVEVPSLGTSEVMHPMDYRWRRPAVFHRIYVLSEVEIGAGAPSRLSPAPFPAADDHDPGPGSTPHGQGPRPSIGRPAHGSGQRPTSTEGETG